jgi:hypothetical protein
MQTNAADVLSFESHRRQHRQAAGALKRSRLDSGAVAPQTRLRGCSAPDCKQDRLRTMPRIAATTTLALLLMVGQHAHATEPKVIALSCDGTFKDTMLSSDARPEPMERMGVMVNLDERTVSFGGYVARIKEADSANIAFGGMQVDDERDPFFKIGIMGDIDRVTGHMSATVRIASLPTNANDPKKFGPASTILYDLLCKVASRLF